jgi:phage/plasmid-like protein (TIGR03299 family)
MAHMVENMFSVRETPWHGLGVLLGSAPTTREAIVAAGLDWAVDQQPLFLQDGRKAPALVNVRSTDKSILGVTGPATGVLQNVDAFSFFDPFLEAKECELETAGSLRQGARVWVLAKILRAPSVIVPGDEVSKYLLLSNSHDGKVAVRVGYTPIRVVCNNTLTAAHDDDASQLIKIHHSRRVKEAVEGVREIMNVADRTFEASAEQYRYLATVGVDATTMLHYVRRIFNLVPAAKGDIHRPTSEVRAEIEKTPTYQKVMAAFETGRGNNMPGVKGTWWAAYNAVTEFLAYERGKNQAIRLDNLWFGSAANTNKNALKLAVEYAQAA